ERRESAVRRLPQLPDVLALRLADSATIVARHVRGSVRRPVDRAEVFLELVRIDQDVDELAIEGRQPVYAGEALHDSSEGRLDRLPRATDSRRVEVACPRDPIGARRRALA